MEPLTNSPTSRFPSNPKPLFSPSLTRAQGLTQLINHLAILQASIEPKLQYNERMCFELGPPIDGEDPIAMKEFIKKGLASTMEMRSHWSMAVKVLGEDYQKAFGKFTVQEKEVYEGELKVARTMACDFDSWFLKVMVEEDEEGDVFYDAVEWL